MTQLPTTIKVGWAVYVVDSWPESEARDRSRAGEINFQKLTIQINDGCAPQKQAETLMHEISHAISIVWSISTVDLAKDRDPDEQLSLLMGHAWTTVMCDNPDLRRYLDEVWPR